MSVLIIKDNGYKISTNKEDLTFAILANGWIGVNRIDEKYNKHRLLSNDVDFFWGTGEFEEETLLISYKGIELEKFENPNNQLILDYLNKYDSLSKTEIEVLANKAMEDSKTQLELEIKTLQADKDKLLNQIEILKQIVEKKDGIKLLFDKLND